MRPECHQCDCTCAMIAIAFAASVDVTGAVCDIVTTRVGRSHRSRFNPFFAGTNLSYRCHVSSHKSDSGHALLSRLD